MEEHSVKRESTPKMLAESLREAGLLVLVFGGLIEARNFSPVNLTLVVVAGFVFLIGGYVLERKRKE